MCVCAGVEQVVLPLPQPGGLFAAQTLPTLSVAVDNSAACTQRYQGTVFGLNAGRMLDTLHFLSAGAVGFARGLNDTPKIAGLLLVASALDIRWGLLTVAMGKRESRKPGQERAAPFRQSSIFGKLAPDPPCLSPWQTPWPHRKSLNHSCPANDRAQ
jgi:hypothetical protein